MRVSFLRASFLTLFTVIVLASVSLFARGPNEGDGSNSPSNVGDSSSGLDERRNLETDPGDLITVDPSFVNQAEAEIHSWLNTERKKNCKELKTYHDSGKVNFAMQNFSNRMQQFLVEVKYGQEIFFARIALVHPKENKNNNKKFKLEELVPGPCDKDYKNGLAVTAEGTDSSAVAVHLIVQ